MELGRSPSGTIYSLVIQTVARRYEPRDLPERIELLTIPLQSIVVVQIRTRYDSPGTYGRPETVFDQQLKVIGAYGEGSQMAYYGQLVGGPDGLALAVKPLGNQLPGIPFRSDHVLRIEQKPPDVTDENVIEMAPIYEVRQLKAVPSLDDAIGLYFDNKLIGLVEAEHAPALMHILKPPYPETAHESDQHQNDP